MNLNERFDVRPEKLTELLARMDKLSIDPAKIDERFVRGSGPGGQKINKTASCVVLRYEPLDLTVRCQRERKRSLNRFLALRDLVDKIEEITSPGTSKRAKQSERRKKNRSRSRSRSKAKHRKIAEQRKTRDSGSSSE